MEIFLKLLFQDIFPLVTTSLQIDGMAIHLEMNPIIDLCIEDISMEGMFLESTSHIESLWGVLKQNIKSIYNIIPSNNFLLF